MNKYTYHTYEVEANSFEEAYCLFNAMLLKDGFVFQTTICIVRDDDKVEYIQGQVRKMNHPNDGVLIGKPVTKEQVDEMKIAWNKMINEGNPTIKAYESKIDVTVDGVKVGQMKETQK